MCKWHHDLPTFIYCTPFPIQAYSSKAFVKVRGFLVFRCNNLFSLYVDKANALSKNTDNNHTIYTTIAHPIVVWRYQFIAFCIIKSIFAIKHK